MDAEELVVDQTLDEIEGAPARQQHPDMNAPRRRQLPSLPGPYRQQHATDDEEPCRQVEEPVGEGVRLETGDCTARMVPRVREQVMPLQDLVENDAVDEPTKAQPQDERRRSGRSGAESVGGSRQSGHEASYPLRRRATNRARGLTSRFSPRATGRSQTCSKPTSLMGSTASRTPTPTGTCLEEDDRLTVVDCGVPTSWRSLGEALAKLGKRDDDIAAIVLTHAHFDHIGFAEKARRALGVPVWVHDNDVPLTRHPQQYSHERPRSYYFATQVRAMPIVAALARARAFFPNPIEAVERYEAGPLPVPGSPQAVFTPGHTMGHCALHLPESNAVLAGDDIVTLDPTGARRAHRSSPGCHRQQRSKPQLPGCTP